MIASRDQERPELSTEFSSTGLIRCYLHTALYFAISQGGPLSSGGLLSGGPLSSGGLLSGGPLPSSRLSEPGLSSRLSEPGLSDGRLSEEGLLDGRLVLAADTVENSWSTGDKYEAIATNATAMISIFLCLANEPNTRFINEFLCNEE